MTCVINRNDNACNLDYHLALSVATCSYNEESCLAEDLDDCSKRSAPSRSSWEAGAAAASCAASCAGAFTSSSLPLQGPALPDKVLWAAWEDDRTTQEDEGSTRSECDECDDPDEFEAENEILEIEPAKRELPARRVDWANLVDTDTEDDDTSSVDAEGGSVIDEPAAPAARWADIAESDEEFMEAPTSQVGPVPSADVKEEPTLPASVAPRTSRRARAARANSAADDHREAAPQEKMAEKGIAKGSGKSAEKGSSKGAEKGKSAGKGATGKGAGKSFGKGGGSTAKGGGKAGGKGSKGKGKGEKGAGKGGSEKYQCQIVVGIEEDNKFRVVRRLIGAGGENMKNINQQTDAKLRLRGRGSKFLEGDAQQESTDDLMLCISAQDKAGYEHAKTMAYELIEGIQHSYRNFCHKASKVCPDFKLEIHEGYREGSR